MTQNERIQAIRKELGLTMDEFGSRLGVGRSAISHIEKGNRNLSDQMSRSICREFGVNEIWLQTGDGEMFAPMTDEDLIAKIVNQMSFRDEPAKKAAITTFMNASEEQVMLFLQMLYKELEKNGITFDE